MNMDQEQAEKRAKEILGSKGYSEFEIITNVHIVGTNVRSIRVRCNKLEISLDLDDNTGKLLSIQNHHFREIRESMHMEDTVRADLGLLFKLTENIKIGGKINSSENVRVIKLQSNSDEVEGISITVKDKSDKTIEDAQQKARRILNWISFKLGKKIDHERPILITKDKQQELPITAIPNEPFDLDLKSNELGLVIGNKDQILTQKLAILANGMKSYEEKNYGNAIRDFCLVIDKYDEKLYKCYAPLRNALSHFEVCSDLEKLKVFNLSIIDSNGGQKYIDMNRRYG